MTRTAGAPIGCQRPSRFWGLGCHKIYHKAEDTLALFAQGYGLFPSTINALDCPVPKDRPVEPSATNNGGFQAPLHRS
ncbi:hypothetical protein [Thiolapillus sp.]|uniref:hypothetical protein n=1 Tax=Thiolapillus sp. TaxID=2017437 RepID=UPI00263B659F|nr:hypothetical protein [Thiolapillus sp.]